MAFKLSSRSLGKLEGVNELLVDTVKRAIEVSKVDFGVIYGVRSLEEQEKFTNQNAHRLCVANTLSKKTEHHMLSI